MTPRVPPVPCGRGRCKRTVYHVKIMKNRGAPVGEEIDALASTWADGARIKLIPSDHLPDGEQLAEKLTAAQAHRAFATRDLYVPHADQCPAQKKKTTTAKKNRGHD
jgi:hypothetical protein